MLPQADLSFEETELLQHLAENQLNFNIDFDVLDRLKVQGLINVFSQPELGDVFRYEITQAGEMLIFQAENV